MKLAIAGLDHFHIHGFLQEALAIPETQLVGLYDSVPEVLKQNVERYKVKGYENFEEMLEKSGADVIATACINKEKADIICKSLERGFPVIADKPLVTTVEEFFRVKYVYENTKDAKLYMMLTERFNPPVYTAKKYIDEGKIGKVVNMISLRPHKLNIETRPSWFFNKELYSGLMNDLGVHDMDVFRWFADSDIVRVQSCFQGNKGDPELTDFSDHSEASLLLADNSTAYVRLDWLTPKAYPTHGDCRFIVIGTEGQLEAFTYDNKLIFFNNETPPVEVPTEKRPYTFTEDVYMNIKDPSHKTAISPDDIFKATWAALKAQEVADANLGGLQI